MTQTSKLFLLLTVATAIAMAGPTLTFHSPGGVGTVAGPTTSSIGYTPGVGAKAIGSYIPIANFDAMGFVTNNGSTINCSNCFLSFTTGVATVDTPQLPASQFWSFSSAGSSFTIVGTGIDGVNFGGPVNLLSGMFAAPITVSSTPTADIKFVASTILNSVYSGVASYFAFPYTTGWTGTYSQTFSARRFCTTNIVSGSTYTSAPCLNPTGTAVNPSAKHMGFATTLKNSAGLPQNGVMAGTVVDTRNVPEPTSMILFGTMAGLLGLVVARRRKQAA